MKRINPIYLLLAFNVLLYLCRDFLIPEDALADMRGGFETSLLRLGLFGHIGVVLMYGLCGFLFVPLLIPLNILCGALYGAYVGTGISLAGIIVGCIASTVSVRYVFRGMERAVESQPLAQKVIRQVEQRGDLTVILVRLAFVVPYLIQNIALAVTSIGLWRLTALTAVGSIPSAAIYSFLGAGLVQSESVSQLALYMAVPLVLLVGISMLLKTFDTKS